MADQPPSVELLEEQHSFPCPYTFKVIGSADDTFEGRVASCVQQELGLDTPPATSRKTTAGGRHQSVTVEPVCPDASAVLRLYKVLRAVPGVMFLF